MKQRTLTAKQRKLLELQHAGASDAAIAGTLGVQIGTVRLKRAALRAGIAKGAYSDLGELHANFDSKTRDLFEGVLA